MLFPADGNITLHIQRLGVCETEKHETKCVILNIWWYLGKAKCLKMSSWSSKKCQTLNWKNKCVSKQCWSSINSCLKMLSFYMYCIYRHVQAYIGMINRSLSLHFTEQETHVQVKSDHEHKQKKLIFSVLNVYVHQWRNSHRWSVCCSFTIISQIITKDKLPTPAVPSNH